MTDRHTHEWETAGTGYTCTECDETSATCVAGNHPTGSSLLICDQCLHHEHHVLDGTADALTFWQYEPRSDVPAIRYDRDRSDSGEDHTPRPISRPHDIVEVLWTWTDMWAETLHSTQPNFTNPVAALKSMLIWAAHHEEESAFSEYRREVRAMRHHARRFAGLLPKRHYGPCVHCGGHVVQDWADQHWQPLTDGLSDALRCTGCGTTWGDHGRWMFTNQHTLRLLPDHFPEHLVTIEEAWIIFPQVPKATWRKWRERDDQRMPIRSWDERGRPLYRVGDLADTAQCAGKLKPTA